MASQLPESGIGLVTGMAGTASLPSLQEPSLWERVVFQLGALSGEYLFFIGATFVAVLLLKARRRIWATATFGLAVMWLTFHLPVTLYLESLGADSFAETHNFDMEEARFWLQTLREAIQPDFSLKKFVAYLSVALISFYALRWVFHRRGFTGRLYVGTKVALSLAFIGLAFHQTTAKALAFYLENTEKFQTTAANFNHEPPALQLTSPPMDLVVYIGESTSVMNMGLYGYPRDTTPQLSALAAQDRRLVVFDHVFSTHAHTSRSLLEALSFGLDARQMYVPITDRQRVSVVDVLRTAGLAPRLISNQGTGGSWDQASSVIFRHSVNTFRARAGRSAGAGPVERSFDDEFFEDQLDALTPPPGRSQVLFLHSYSGHGPYHKNIPERFRRPVDRQLQELPRAQVVADAAVPIDQIEEYDAAIRYVDHSVAKAVARVRASGRPTVLVYFSDHGDAVYGGLGHDSARFRHEMARVPFLLYFNDAARQARPGLWEKYRQLAAAGRSATLAQLPSTLLDLLGGRLADAQAVLQTPVIGEAATLPPVMVRQTAEGMTFVNLSGLPAPAFTPGGHRIIDRTDEDTRRYLAARTQLTLVRDGCRNPAPTLEALSRQIMLLRCAPVPTLVVRGGP